MRALERKLHYGVRARGVGIRSGDARGPRGVCSLRQVLDGTNLSVCAACKEAAAVVLTGGCKWQGLAQLVQ